MGADCKCKAKVEFLPLTKDMVAECLRSAVYIEDPEPQKKDNECGWVAILIMRHPLRKA